MNAVHSHASPADALFAPAKELDPESPEFFDACQALVKRSTGRRLKATPLVDPVHVEAPQAPEAPDVPAAPIPPIAPVVPAAPVAPIAPAVTPAAPVAAVAPVQLPQTNVASEYDAAALREARRRENEVRARVQALEAELTGVKARYNETVAALEVASQRAGQARVEFENAMAAIAARDTAINQLRQAVADQDREIDELQRRLLASEEARSADAASILESLDTYRT